MKTLLFTILFSLLSSASTQVKVDAITPLHTYNHKPSIQLKKQRNLRALANIKKKDTINIVFNSCNQDIQSSKLTHRGQLLLYRIYTESCRIEINALDGAIISKVLF